MILPDTPQAYWQRQALIEAMGLEATPLQYDQMLEAYYRNNGLYQAVQLALYEAGIWTPGMIGLRNPAHRAVEFHVSHIWPGKLGSDLQIISKNKQLPDAVAKIWEWSNWGAKKQLAARWFALYGSWFCKVATKNITVDNGNGTQDVRAKRVYLKSIKPGYVVDFEADERDYLTYIRMDIPHVVRSGNNIKSTMRTEIWSKADGYAEYKHSKPYGSPISMLGIPTETHPLSDFGIDFLPFVFSRFVDDGDKRGVGCFTHVLDKIDEANRMATRLHQILFRYNKPTTVVLANAMDPSGRPLPPPQIAGGEDGGTVTVNDSDIMRLPGVSKMEYLVPPLNYESYIKALDEMMGELEQDLPELAYYRLRDMGSNLSGRAVRLLLSQAIDRVVEARGNIEPALARADAMALTIAANANLPGFDNIGSYENGDFEHSFADRPVISESDFEQAETIKKETESGIPLITAVRRRGWTDAEVAQMEADKEAESAAASMDLAQALLEAERRAAQNDEVAP